jgi:hypothetical protein
LEEYALALLDTTAVELARLTGQTAILLPSLVDGPFQPAFAVELSTPSMDSIRVELDDAAARAVAQALLARQAGLRATGGLTSAEHGLLEFATLCSADACNRTGSRIAIQSFWRGGERAPSRDANRELRFDIRTGLGSGRARVLVPLAAPAAEYWEFPARANAGPELRACLGTIDLDRTELSELSPGDVVLVGPADRASFASGVSLVTPNGWRVARASVVDDSPLALVLRKGSFSPEPLWRAADNGARVSAVLLSGSVSCSADMLGEWEATPTLELRKDAEAPVELIVAGGTAARGEWVRVGAEAGLRVWSLGACP